MGEKTCQFCKFGNAVVGLPDGVLVCDYPPAGEKSYTATTPSESCDNFQPTDSAPPTGALDPGTRRIPVTPGRFAIVDAADYDKLSKYKWWTLCHHNTAYAVTLHKGKYLYMHRLVMDAPTGLVVDHIDHNGLNNTRKNLRLCTAKQNLYNRRPQKGGTSKYKGVSWKAQNRKFCVKIAYEGKQYHLGCFTDEKEAARAYDKKANELFGEFAYLNFPADLNTKYGTSARGGVN